MKTYISNMGQYPIKKMRNISRSAIFLLLVGIVTASTVVYSFAASKDSARSSFSNFPIISMASTPSGHGYWLVASDGGIFSFGDAEFYGSTGGMRLNKPIIAMASTPTGRGYWLVASDGGIFTFGDAEFYGSTGSANLNQPVIHMAATPSGRGYWLLGADGGIFAFGDAGFYGSTGSLRLNKPIVSMTPSSTGRGYWLVASDGGIFAFGDAEFYGSAGGVRLLQPVVGISKTAGGYGYTLVAKDGGIFNFGDSEFYGATSGNCLGSPTVAMASSNYNGGYLTITADGQLSEFGPGVATPCPPPAQNGCTGNRAAKKIIVSIDEQHLWACEGESLYLDTPITTGAEDAGHGTPVGTFAVYSKQRNTYLVGPGYRSHVDYWMPFIRGYGLHDAAWRRQFGVAGFESAGSHGCVNMPPSITGYIYNWVQVGTQVTIKR